MSAPRYRLYQIFYDDISRAQIDESYYIPLDNCDGPKDWFEFWPILKFLRENELEKDVRYGFFSPKFPEKAQLTHQDVLDTLDKHPSANAVLFTFHWPALCLYQNVWEYGEVYHPGLTTATETFLKTQHQLCDLSSVIGTLDNSVHSNYVVGDRTYWRAWQALAEAYFQYVEEGNSDLIDNISTSHAGQSSYVLRTFVQERLACWLLAQGTFSVGYPNYLKDGSLRDVIPYDDDRILRLLLRLCHFSKSMARQKMPKAAMMVFRVCKWLAFRRIEGLTSSSR